MRRYDIGLFVLSARDAPISAYRLSGLSARDVPISISAYQLTYRLAMRRYRYRLIGLSAFWLETRQHDIGLLAHRLVIVVAAS